MKFTKIFRMEFGYQLGQPLIWIYFAVVFALSYFHITLNFESDAREGHYLLNSPILVAMVTSICTLFWLLIGASVAGDAATRDLQTRMLSLTYTINTSKADYLGGRFVAALTLNLLVLLAIPIGLIAAIYLTGIEREILGPFSTGAYITALFYLLLPNAFIATAIQFSLSVINKSAMFSYVVGALLFFASYPLWLIPDGGQKGAEALLDPLYFTPVLHFQGAWSLIERNNRLIELSPMLLGNRLLWLLISIAALALAYFRFRFTEVSKNNNKRQFLQGVNAGSFDLPAWSKTLSLPRLSRTFTSATHFSQLKLITLRSFWGLAKKPAGLLMLAIIAAVAGLAMTGNLAERGTHLLPRTDLVLNVLTAPITDPGKFWTMIFALAVFYAGELIWRERESGMADLTNAAPVPEWVLFVGRYLALIMLLLCAIAFLMLAGILSQLAIGGADVKLVPYLQVLFGFQFAECLLFTALALFVHVMVNQKYLGHLVIFSVMGCILFAPLLGIEHHLLIFGASPRWTYTSLGGFASSVAPWLWFKAYWAAWALLLTVLTLLFWVRSRDISFKGRLLLARRRFTRSVAFITLATVILITGTGGFVFYNTNVLNKYRSSSEITAERAQYERLYGQFRDTPQPILTDVSLQVEIYPRQQNVEIRGRYQLVNTSSVSIASLHLGTPEGAKTTGLIFSRQAKLVHSDAQMGVMIYALKEPLKLGDTLQLGFTVRNASTGFPNDGANSPVTDNFTQIKNHEWLPVIGYQQYREVDEPGLRKKYELKPRLANASLYDVKARGYAPFSEPVSLNMVVGTDEQQTVVAPGSLRKAWKKGGRRYFRYITDAPIRNDYSFLSAKYALYEQKWTPLNDPRNPVAVQIYYDPGNTANLQRIMQSLKSSLAYYTEQFEPYPSRQLRFLARAGYGGSNHADPGNITAEEAYFLLRPEENERGFDLVTAVAAHETAHQWWGKQLRSAYVEGAGLLSESVAWYSAMGMLEQKYGPAHLKKLLDFLMESYQSPRSKAGVPLLQATDSYSYYRKGPLALYAMSVYIGREKVNTALRSLLQKHRPGQTPMPTSLDLYHELQAVTPDSLRYLLHDLFRQNTFWNLKAKQAVMKQTGAGNWQVTFTVDARKTVVNEVGVEKRVPLKDWIEIGVFGASKNAEEKGRPLYLRKHFFSADEQTITITVPSRPSQVGIDPDHLLIDWEIRDNFTDLKD